jgi:hypothetical protein
VKSTTEVTAAVAQALEKLPAAHFDSGRAFARGTTFKQELP